MKKITQGLSDIPNSIVSFKLFLTRSLHAQLLTLLLFIPVGICFSVGASTAAAQTRVWGDNTFGQIGDGTSGNTRKSPLIIAPTDITGLSGGFLHTLALKSDGTVLAWGYNRYGQRGDGTTNIGSSCDCNPVPGPVSGLSNVVAVSGGAGHSLALTSDGTVWAWGRNQFGQIGDGTTMQRVTPVEVGIGVSGFTNIIAIKAGDNHNLALKSDGTVWAWGNNSGGQIGNGTFSTAQVSPIQVLTDVIAISAGAVHSIALKRNGTVFVWGDNGSGQLGSGSTQPNSSNVPILNTTLTDIINIAAGSGHNVALKRNGTVFVWGFNFYGQAGNGTSGGGDVYTPTLVPTLTNVANIRAGGVDTLASTGSGKLFGWGGNGQGQSRGDGSSSFSQPTPFEILSVGTSNSVFDAGYYINLVSIPSAPTATGSNVRLFGENVNVTFSNVTGAGNTNMTAIDPTSTNLTVPAYYTIVSNSTGYNVTTTATTATGSDITVCLKTSSVADAAQFAQLKLLHGEGAALVDRTTTKNYPSREICGVVTSFSPFVIAEFSQPTAALATVGGRIINDSGRGISRARVTLTNASGEARTVLTNSFGYYRFDEVSAGQTYILSVNHKLYNFTPQAVSVNEAIANFNFIALP